MLTTVASFREPWEAHMFCGRLAFEGIPATVAFDNHVGMNWPWSTGLGWVKVQVPRSWQSEARDIEKRCRSGEFRRELSAEFGDLDDLKCPVCGSQHHWKRRTTFQVLFAVLLFYFGAPSPPWSWLYHCETCGETWKDRR